MQLCERIKYNITMKSYAGEWDNNNEDTNSNRSDDPMEIDAMFIYFIVILTQTDPMTQWKLMQCLFILLLF
jgi:hypothetical protein